MIVMSPVPVLMAVLSMRTPFHTPVAMPVSEMVPVPVVVIPPELAIRMPSP